MLPSKWLAEALSAFYAEFPTVALNLHVEALGAVTALVLHRKAVIGVSGPLAAEMPGIENVIIRSEEHTSELQSLMRSSYAVFCLKKKRIKKITKNDTHYK